MTAKRATVRVGISIGDFNGIGPEIILKTLRDKGTLDFFTPIIFATAKLMTYQRNVLKLQQNFNIISTAADAAHGKINIVEISAENYTVTAGTPTPESSQLAITSLQTASEALKNGDIDVLVTAPINKDAMLREGFTHTGHTGFLEDVAGKKGLMFLVSERLKVAVLTHHIPLAEVSSKITSENILSHLQMLNDSLIRDFCIQKPKIAVLGLNPHAGDGGQIGTEENDIIIPAIRTANESGILAFGPFPADSYFQPEKYEFYDAVLAMYHDQGLAPFKTLAYEEGVNFTANLPFVRTSPDHGTAYDIAGKNRADERSFTEAVFTAISIFRNRTEYAELTSQTLSSNPAPLENRRHC